MRIANKSNLIISLLVLNLMLFVGFRVQADEIYTYTDRTGSKVFVTNPEDVPPEYRDQLEDADLPTITTGDYKAPKVDKTQHFFTRLKRPFEEGGFSTSTKVKFGLGLVALVWLGMVLGALKSLIGFVWWLLTPIFLLFRLRPKRFKREVFIRCLCGVVLRFPSFSKDYSSEEMQNFISSKLSTGRGQSKIVAKALKKAKKSNRAAEACAKEFYKAFSDQPQMAITFVDILICCAVDNGSLDAFEESIIKTVATIIGISPADFQALKASYVGARATSSGSSGAIDNYSVLGCPSGASEEEVKKNYRKLAQQWHPDKLSSLGLPEELVSFAKEKFISIQDAYESISEKK